MKYSFFPFLFLAIFSCTKAKKEVPLSSTPEVHYETTIKRIINENCISCHDAGTGFPLDTREHVMAVVKSGQVLGALKAPMGAETPYLHMPPYYKIQQEDIDSIQIWKLTLYPD